MAIFRRQPTLNVSQLLAWQHRNTVQVCLPSLNRQCSAHTNEGLGEETKEVGPWTLVRPQWSSQIANNTCLIVREEIRNGRSIDSFHLWQYSHFASPNSLLT